LTDAIDIANPVDRVAQQLLAPDMAAFWAEIRAALEPQSEYLTSIERQLYERGKKLRPIIMILAARMIAGAEPLPVKVAKGAASLEMLHVATLIHDDIIDDALMRRGLPSVSAARGPKKALLVGDLQFVQALRGFVDAIDTDSDMTLVRLVLDTAFDICRGELDELETPFAFDARDMRAKYLTTIERKTAVLFGLACEAGISLAGGRTHEARRGGFFGRRFGRAFQIMDDVLDIIQHETSAGKEAGTDLLQKRWSLPLIYAVEEFGPAHPVSRTMRGEGPLDPALLHRCLSDLKNSRALDRAYADARDAALECLFYLQPFPPSLYREALEELALYIVDRPIESAATIFSQGGPQPHAQ
jgi:heptaprenyl diphosphate synthase